MNRTHGLSFVNGKRTPLHRLWLNIRSRCNNPRHPDYRYYGGRGITVCKRWDRFVDFVADVGPHPGKGWTLDRIKNGRGYYKSNVRWATRQTQARNRDYCGLNESMAVAIRKAYGGPPLGRGPKSPYGIKQSDLAKRFGVSQPLISKVLRGEVWR